MMQILAHLHEKSLVEGERGWRDGCLNGQINTQSGPNLLRLGPKYPPNLARMAVEWGWGWGRGGNVEKYEPNANIFC